MINPRASPHLGLATTVESFIAAYAREIRPLFRALKALESGDHQTAHRCCCPFHTASLYSMNPRLIRPVIAECRAKLEQEVSAYKKAWQFQATERALRLASEG
jgi:hypothetical protein